MSSRKIGVAISGGGHRATLWGLGSLLYLVDKGVNDRVSTIVSVSGGSIANGVVGQRVDFAGTNAAEIRIETRGLVDHIANDGLFFYGSGTNRYLTRLLTLAALTAAGIVLVVGVPLARGVRYLLDAVGIVGGDPLDTIDLWPIGLALTAGFGVMVFVAWKASQVGNSPVTRIGLLGVAIGVGLIIWNIVADPIEWDRLPVLVVSAVVTAVLATMAVLAFGKRSVAAEAAMDRAHFGGAALSELGAKSADTTHIICASEMQSGIHAFFSGDFIYSNEFGIATATGELQIAKAVQSSAALPGAFGPRKIDSQSLIFEKVVKGEDKRGGIGEPLILMDGGVYDNMADQWFIGLGNRRERWLDEYQHLIPQVDDLVVANASTGWAWQSFGKSAKRRMARETRALTRVLSLLYNTVGRRRRAHLVDTWAWAKSENRDDPKVRGAFVEVDDVPIARARGHLHDRLNEIGAPVGGWEAIVKQSRDYKTVLRRVEEPTATQIMWHAYIVTAVATDMFLDVEATPDDLLDYETFKAGVWG